MKSLLVMHNAVGGRRSQRAPVTVLLADDVTSSLQVQTVWCEKLTARCARRGRHTVAMMPMRSLQRTAIGCWRRQVSYSGWWSHSWLLLQLLVVTWPRGRCAAGVWWPRWAVFWPCHRWLNRWPTTIYTIYLYTAHITEILKFYLTRNIRTCKQ